LAKALAAAQAEIEPALRDSENPFFKSKYADLASVWRAIRGPLSKHGIAVVQAPQETDGQTVAIKTILLHESGESIEGMLRMVPKDTSPQAMGSCITYARRYALAAMVGVCPDDDDDGEAAQGRAVRDQIADRMTQPPPKKAPAKAPRPSAATSESPEWKAFCDACYERARKDLNARPLSGEDIYRIAKDIQAIEPSLANPEKSQAERIAGATKWLKDQGRLAVCVDDESNEPVVRAERVAGTE
jgi:hypothetical protein